MRTPEFWEKKELDAYLESIGAYVVKATTFGMGKSGHADRFCCIRGMFWAFEVKRQNAEPTVLQNRRMDEVRAAGGNAAWGTASKIIAEVKSWLEQKDSDRLGREISFG